MVGLLNKQGHDVERYIYDAYGRVTMVSNPLFDVNFDGVASMADGKIICGKIGQDPCSAGPIHDLNGDGDIDLGDCAHPPISPWWDENEVIPASGLGNPYHFTGRRLDPYLDVHGDDSGVKQIQYNRARYYDLDNGRWLQRDPAEYVDGMNLYEYVRSNPARGVDPSGFKTVPCVTRGFDGPAVFPPYHDWVPHWDPYNTVRQDRGGFDAFRIHWMKNSGNNLYFRRGSSYSQWLDGTDTVKDMKLALGDNIRLEALGNAKRLLECDEKDVTCIRADLRKPFLESPGGYFGTDWLSMGNLNAASYSICKISKSCCIGGRNCTKRQANCHTVFVAWDHFHFNWPWKSFRWYATLQDHFPRGTEYNPPGCGGR